MMRRRLAPLHGGMLVLFFANGCTKVIVEEGATPPAAAAAAATVVPTHPAVPVTIAERGNVPILPTGITSFGATSIEGDLYVLGGYSGESHAYHRDSQSGELLHYDARAGAWERLDVVEPVQGVALVPYENSLIRVGGMEARNPKGEAEDLHSLDVVARFDLASRQWQPLPALPIGRSSHDAALMGDTLYVVGGWTLAGSRDAPTWQDATLRLDLASEDPKWTTVETPFRRRALAVAPVAGRLVAMGGITPDRGTSTEVNVFDPELGEWERGPDFPGEGFGMSAINAGDHVYASGADGAIFRFSPGGTWERTATLAYPRFFHRLVQQSDHELLIVGGIRHSEGGGERVRPVETVDVGAERVPSLLSLDLPSPLPTKNRQGVALVGDELYVFGGNTSLGQHDFEPQFFSDKGFTLNLSSLEWKEATSFPIARQTMTTVQTKQGVTLALGGFGHDGEVARSHPEVFAYDAKAHTWSNWGGRLPGDGRTQFGTALHGDALFVFGGLSYDPRRPKDEQFHHETGVLRASLQGAASASTGRETQPAFEPTKIEIPRPRRAFASAMLGDRYVMVGGMRDNFELVEPCDAYSFADGKWSEFPCPAKPRLSGDMVALGGRLYLAGGSVRAEAGADLTPNRSLEVYDATTGAWTILVEDLPIEPKHLRMLAYGDHLLLFSTHQEGSQARVLLVGPPAP